MAAGLFDVEQFRGLTRRQALIRQVGQPTLVLGSTQRPDIASPDSVREQGVETVRRRGGGGAVLLRPDDHLWVDAWVPRGDPLWTSDISAAAHWVGDWWQHALGVSSQTEWTAHQGSAVPGAWGDLVCFAGRGPGEVFWGQRKVVGLSQWRSREGALFMSCAYIRWQPQALVDLLQLDADARSSLLRVLDPMAAGLLAVQPALPEVANIAAALLSSFPEWGGDVRPAS